MSASVHASRPRALVAGNWKMNGVGASLSELTTLARDLGGKPGCDVMICPPATLVARMADQDRKSTRLNSSH